MHYTKGKAPTYTSFLSLRYTYLFYDKLCVKMCNYILCLYVNKNDMTYMIRQFFQAFSNQFYKQQVGR